MSPLRFRSIAPLLALAAAGLGCLSGASDEDTRKWREKEIRAQETRADLAKRGDEFARISAPERLVRDPYLKSKIVIVYTWADGRSEITEDNMNRLNSHADAKDEAKSVLKVKCSEIPAGKYVFKDGGNEIPAFSSKCETELIDLSIPALIYRKSFENTKLDESIKKGVFGKVPEKVVAPNPLDEIDDFVRALPEK
jgi:hypothetical protein